MKNEVYANKNTEKATLMRLLEKRTEVENEIMKIYNTEKAHFCIASSSTL